MKYKLRRYYLYYLGRALAFLFFLAPLRAAVIFGGWLGEIAYILLGKYRRIALGNLTSALGVSKTRGEMDSTARAVFRNLGKNAAEMINFPKINKSNIDEFVTVENGDILDRELKKGKGALMLTGHFGNWELLALTFRVKGYKGSVIGRRIYFHKYDGYLNKLRRIHDVNIIYRDESPKRILRALKDNNIVGILADQDVDSVDGVFVSFFGKEAFTPAGPAVLARVSGASLIPAFMVREGQRHRLIVEEPVKLVDTGDKEKDIIANTQRWSDVVEAYIRKYPDHWVWMHRRWKTVLGHGS